LSAAPRYAVQPAPASQQPGAAVELTAEGEIGSLEPGKRADFTVLGKNPLYAGAERITGIRVLATVLDGTPVYQSAEVLPAG